MRDYAIIVCTHKTYEMPRDVIYIPVFLGGHGETDSLYADDNTGENISAKNPYYSELTGLYWAWKNIDAEYIGLVHYRRHFASFKRKKSKNKIDCVLDSKDIEELLKDNDVVLASKRKYFIENLYSHYEHTMYVEPLQITGEIIKEKYPDYYSEFLKLHKRTSGHLYNMFIMKNEILDRYCEWLFDVLFELEKRVDFTKYDSFHSRFFGRISELLLDIWINTNNIEYTEQRVVYIEKVKWFKKAKAFLLAKFFGKKYTSSF